MSNVLFSHISTTDLYHMVHLTLVSPSFEGKCMSERSPSIPRAFVAAASNAAVMGGSPTRKTKFLRTCATMDSVRPATVRLMPISLLIENNMPATWELEMQ